MPVSLEVIFENLSLGNEFDQCVAVQAIQDELNAVLREHVDDIWDDGLELASFNVLVSVFTDAELDKTFRCLTLDCLVPCEVIPDPCAEKMILWVICNCISLQYECAEVLRWLKCMVRYNMINPEVIDRWYNELLKRLLYPNLVSGLSEILSLSAKPEFMTKSNVNLLQSFYEEHYENINIKRILWEYAQHVPHLVDQKFHFSKPSLWDKPPTGFELVVKNIACRAKVKPSRASTGHQILCRDLSAVEYQTRRKDENLKKIGEVRSMFELGRALERLQLPTNELALLQSEEGIMTLILNGPSYNFISSLSVALSKGPTRTLIAAVSGIQDLLSYGLPPVTAFLSEFLITWDGNYMEEYVYALIPRLYFQDYKELEENILDHLSRVFVTECAQTKAKILDCLLHLITHMVAVDTKRGNLDLCQTIQAPKWVQESDSTVPSVIEYTIELCKQGLAIEGPDSTLLVLNSILLYEKLNRLILQCDLPLFFVIHQSLSCTALLSKNHTILNELCLLILQYKRELISFLEQQGLLGEYELQVESVMALADSTFKYLWECVGGERPENFHMTQDEFTPTESIGVQHLALYPFMSTLAKELKRELKDMDRNDLMAILECFMSGVAEFIKYEEIDQLRSM